LFGTPVLAHHSFAMFDQDKTAIVTGNAKELEWINPHVWLHIVAMQDGKPVTWSFEAGGPAQLAVSGWGPNSVKPGDKLVVGFHPLKDGSHGGQLEEVTFSDGRKLCQGPECRAAAGINIPGGRPRNQD
jgi:hypothetical protein